MNELPGVVKEIRSDNRDFEKPNFNKRVESSPEVIGKNSDSTSFDKRVDTESVKDRGAEPLNNGHFNERVEQSTESDKTNTNRIDFLSKDFQNYIKKIEDYSTSKILADQLDKVNEFLVENKIEPISPEENRKKRIEFANNKNSFIKKWERENGKEWPRYSEDLIDEKGNVIRKKGDLYDAHHIIELKYGGLNESWNITPISADKHKQLHKDEECLKIFPLS